MISVGGGLRRVADAGAEIGLWARVRRALSVPARSGHVAALDGWRGLCILIVVLGHFFPPSGPFARAGVEFFFVLSGRLMAEILIFKRQPLWTFVQRRAARILPALWFYVAATAAAMNAALWLQGLPTKWLSPAAAALFVHNYLPGADVVAMFEHSWSLAVEEHGYLLLGLIAVATARSRRAAAWAAMAIALLAIANGVRLWLNPPTGAQSVFWRSDVRVASVLVSFAFCLWLRPRLEAARAPWLACIAPLSTMVALASFARFSDTTPVELVICTCAGALAVNTIEVSAGWFRRWLAHPVMVWAGTISFSLYLWQQLFFAMVKDGAPSLPCLALAILCALWSFKRVENPARDYLLRRISPRLSLAGPSGTR